MRDTRSILPLHVSALGFHAGGKDLLSAISFDLPSGGITAVIGPNGAGKSLLLRLCHGLLTPSSGSVTWGSPGGISAGVKRHGMVFQKPVMLRRSAEANIRHALAASGLPRHERPARTEAALARFGLTDLAARPARLMSGGEQQRLAIARAWALSPEVLFLDEPTSQLDPGATRQIESLLGGLRAEGVTLVMTTHDFGQARRLADRVLFLHRGRLIEDAPATAFFAQPASAEARTFLSGDLLW
ncbi:ATP-binding cassette domain-containing protein [Phreatobacter aquaticus]|uniref:ATP-binding cassette domain-containing protein n=1 Tax=Phreatobacter aquaticus TaxID=2570229 RepID=A0A4D7QPS5_9HYPH|nr:ATP-binding cassette domain-containing protein [Phreatobacter aquaticus]QCK87539.1 ATP-binding cassette domain-containing protein [Phreatobacter aquaticus]